MIDWHDEQVRTALAEAFAGVVSNDLEPNYWAAEQALKALEPFRPVRLDAVVSYLRNSLEWLEDDAYADAVQKHFGPSAASSEEDAGR